MVERKWNAKEIESFRSKVIQLLVDDGYSDRLDLKAPEDIPPDSHRVGVASQVPIELKPDDAFFDEEARTFADSMIETFGSEEYADKNLIELRIGHYLDLGIQTQVVRCTGRFWADDRD